ncbi:hypothetical protein PJP14_29470, partial [Mycobacterium kansasii]
GINNSNSLRISLVVRIRHVLGLCCDVASQASRSTMMIHIAHPIPQTAGPRRGIPCHDKLGAFFT